jgi:hypothetical protein
MRFIIINICFGLLCLSCTQSKREIVFPQTENVKVTLLGDSSIIGIPLDMAKYHNFLLIGDFYGDSLIWVFDVSKNKMMKRWVGKGRGPDEFQSPIQMVFIDSILTIQGRSLFTFGKFHINRSSLTLESVESFVHVPTDVDRLYPLSADIYIASGRFKEGRYALLNHEGKIVSHFGTYPNYKAGEDRIPNFPKFMFHQSMFTYNFKSERLASTTAHVLEFINFSESPPKIEKQILLSNYDYTYDSTDEWAFAQAVDNTQIGVTYVCSTENYIYLVYDPNIENDSDKRAENNQIWIFDWDGNPIKKIQPDVHIRNIFVEDDDKTVYCTVDAPDPAIAFFEITI